MTPWGVLFVQSFEPFRTNLLRTLLALLGIVFGVGAVVAMVSIGEGAQAEILASIEAMGSQLVHIQAKPVAEEALGKTINTSRGLARSDLLALEPLRSSGQVLDLAGAKTFPIHASSLDEDAKSLKVVGVDPRFLDILKKKTSSGRGFLEQDYVHLRNVAVIGYDIAKMLSAADPGAAVGSAFRLNHTWWTVIGVLREPPSPLEERQRQRLPLDPHRFERAIFLPLTTAFTKLAPPSLYGELDTIVLDVGELQRTLGYKRVAERILATAHGGVRDVEVIAPEELLRQQQDTQAVFNVVLLSIAAISLLVGGIGIMNIMLANVLERIREIGVRRAVGATRSHILTQFLAEAVCICLLGGILGVVTGMGIGAVVASSTNIAIAFSPLAIVLSLVIATVVGVVFGLLPARRAALVDPIVALRSE